MVNPLLDHYRFLFIWDSTFKFSKDKYDGLVSVGGSLQGAKEIIAMSISAHILHKALAKLLLLVIENLLFFITMNHAKYETKFMRENHFNCLRSVVFILGGS